MTLREGIDTPAASGELAPALSPTAAISEVSGYTPYFDEPLGSQDPLCAKPTGVAWPIDVEELRTVLDFRSRIDRKPIPGKVLIFDTGFPAKTSSLEPFDVEYFTRQAEAASDPDGDPTLWTSQAHTYYHPGLKNADHGVAVVTLALGGLEVLRSKLLLNFVSFKNGQVLSFMGYAAQNGRLDINGSAIFAQPSSRSPRTRRTRLTTMPR